MTPDIDLDALTALVDHLDEWDGECDCGIEQVTAVEQQLLTMFDAWYGDKAYRKHDEIIGWAARLTDPLLSALTTARAELEQARAEIERLKVERGEALLWSPWNDHDVLFEQWAKRRAGAGDGDWLDPSTPAPEEARVLHVGDGEQDTATRPACICPTTRHDWSGQPVTETHPDASCPQHGEATGAGNGEQDTATTHGWTSHGYACCGKAKVGERPNERARCRGTHGCTTCQDQAAQIHASVQGAADGEAQA